MSTAWLIVVFVVVFIAIALAIVRLRVNPALSLLIGTIALGAATGIPLDHLLELISSGFGSLMAEVGLLISLGVMMGFLMASYGAVQRIVDVILGVFGRRGAPYAFGLTLSTITPAIYFDVLLVLVAPIARAAATRSGRPVASLAGPVAMGLAAGNALVIPGAAMLAYAGAMGLPLQDLVLPGFVLSIASVTVTMLLYLPLMERFGCWRPATDEDLGNLASPAEDSDGPTSPEDRPTLAAAMAPVLVTLALIVAAIIAPSMGLSSSVLAFLGSPVIALLLGVLTALCITVAKKGLSGQDLEVSKALETIGTILVVTAVAGSLGAVIGETGIKDVLSSLFAGNGSKVLPLLIVWVIAALLRAAMGGQTVAGITAIGIIAPLVPGLGLSPVLVVLAAGAGGCFGGQFSDNAFWMLRSLFDLSTRGALKTYTLAQSLLSVVALVGILIADIVL